MYKYLKYIFYCFAFICILLIVLLLSINSLLNSNKDHILSQLAPYHKGQLDFERVSLDLFEDFPSINIKLSEVVAVDSLYDTHQQPLFKASSIKGAVSIRKLLKNELEFRYFSAADGQFNYIIDSSGYDNIFGFIGNLSKKPNNSSSFTINYEDLDIALSNFEVRLIDQKHQKLFSGTLQSFTTNEEQAELILSQIAIKDSLFEQHQEYLLASAEIRCMFSSVNIKDQTFLLDSIFIKNGSAGFITLGDYKNLTNVLQSFKSKPTKENQQKPSNFLGDVVQLNIEHFDLHISNKKVREDFRFNINDLASELSWNGSNLSSNASIETLVDGLGFNLDKGLFLTNAQVTTNVSFDIDFEQKTAHIQPCDLKINDQIFGFKGDLDASGRETLFSFYLNNEATDFNKTLLLLPTTLEDTLSQFSFTKPIKTDILLKGSFSKDDLIWIKVDFEIDDNPFEWKGYKLDGMTTKGYFLNRLFEESQIAKETRKNYQLVFEEITGNYEKINFVATDVHYEHHPDSLLFIDFGINAFGEPESLSKLLGNKDFLFSKGDFNMDLDFMGRMESINNLIKVSDAQLEFNDFEVAYTPAEVIFPIQRLSVDKKSVDAQFDISCFTLNKENQFNITGQLENFTALILDNVKENAKSEATFYSDAISWRDFMDIFGEGGLLDSEEKEKTIQEQKKDMVKLKKVVSGFYESFQPSITIDIDTFNYNKALSIHEFKAEATYIDSTFLLLDNVNFNYEEGNIDLKGILGIADDKTTSIDINFKSENVNLKKLLPSFDYFNVAFIENLENIPENIAVDFSHKGTYEDFVGLVPNTSVGKINFSIDNGKLLEGVVTYEPDEQRETENVSEFFAKINLQIEGKPELMNDLFGNEEFFFRKGKFQVESSYTGDVTTIDELLSKSTTQLEIKDSEVFYKTVGVAFPITQLDLNVTNDTANFSLFMYLSDIEEELKFEGSLRNFTTLLYPNEKTISTDVLISSPHLQWRNFIDLFAVDPEIFKNTDPSFNNSDNFKQTIKGLADNFNPNVKVQIDTAVYNEKFEIRNFKTGLHFTKDQHLILDKTTLDYEEGNAELGVVFNLSDIHTTPFSTSFKVRNIDFGKILESFDYFEIEILEELESITGEVDLDVRLEGVLQDSIGLIIEENRGVVTFNLENVSITGFDMNTLLPKLFKKPRIRDIYFAPIKNTIFLKGNNIEIPQMQILSTAFDIYIGGDYHYKELSNVWIDIPLTNITADNDSLDLLEKRNYKETGKKIHVEGFVNKRGKTKFKIRLNRKRFYKKRGVLKQYKIDRKENRDAYRKWKKSQ